MESRTGLRCGTRTRESACTVNNQRVVDLNQVELKPWSRTFLDVTSDSPVELGAVRIAEAMPTSAR